MSVIFFGAEELGEVVASLPPTFDIRHACQVLAKYSAANGHAYERSYTREGRREPVTFDEIVQASYVSVDVPLERWGTRRRRAESTAALLIYNVIANDGTTFLSDGDRNAIREIEHAVLSG